jgi:ribonucleoside-triphosphate reductase
MSLKALSDYTLYAKYAQYVPAKQRRETWEEMVDRVFDMHAKKYSDILATSKEFAEEFEFAKLQVRKKRVLGSQRALQFGGDPVFKHNARIYNCSFLHVDRIRAFSETVYLLLAGCGVGFSVQKHHVQQLPEIARPTKGVKTFSAPDTIEGWADCVAVLMSSYFTGKVPFPEYQGHQVEFDLTQIRPAGALVAGQFKAPGPVPLSRGLSKIKKVLERRLDTLYSPEYNYGNDEFGNKLRPIDVYDCVMHSADMILSGGIRRSATISLFSFDDEEMMNAKIGNWFIENPQRGRSNNSVVLLRDQVTAEQFDRIMQSTKEFGEPGFYFTDDTEVGANPCVEIGLYPKTRDGRSGVQFCNLCEINGRFCDTEEKFYQLCRAAAIIGTMQAGYTDFKYLSPETKEITETEALLGVSITGIMDNPDVLLKPGVQRKGAELVKSTNRKIAKLLGINPAARTTAVKPAGSTSCVLSTASGIHPSHARRYIRRVQANILEFPVQHFEKTNPLAVETSVWNANGTDKVISFLCEVPKGAIIKNDISAIEFLKQVRSTQQNWVETGTNEELCVRPTARHNVSNTVVVKDNEWEDVTKYIYDNRKWFTGISLLPASGDLDYPQAPFTTVLNAKEIVEQYGDAAVFASGLIVDGLKAFNNNLWAACDTLLGRGEPATTDEATDWIRRGKQFADRYFNGDLKRTTHCLKHVSSWKLWIDLKRSYTEINWAEVIESDPKYVDAASLGAQACAGGACEIQ